MDMAALCAEVSNGERAPSTAYSSSATANNGPIDIRYPQEMNDDVLQEVLFRDPSYAAIDENLIDSKSSLGIRLCQFQTFQGTKALQPCIYNDRQADVFTALAEWESAGHQVYKDARLWACYVQSKRDLPRPCRWLATTIFNFASEMLRPDNTQEYMWTMRCWLDHWFNVASLVFEEVNAPASVPEFDWLRHAHGRAAISVQALEEGDDESDSSNGTVVHHVFRPDAPEFRPGLGHRPITQTFDSGSQSQPFLGTG